MSHRFPLIAALPLFAGLEPDTVREILENTSLERSFDRNEVIFHEGETRREIYLLPQGRIQVELSDPVLEEGKQESKSHAFPLEGPEIFGEIAYLDHAPRSAGTRAMEQVELIIIDPERLTAYLRKNPQTGLMLLGNLAAGIAHKMRTTNLFLLKEAGEKMALRSKTGELASRRYREVVLNTFTRHMKV